MRQDTESVMEPSDRLEMEIRAQAGSRSTRLDASSMSDKVFQKLLQSIMRFELKPFEELSLGHLADEMGVSRTPVRDALVRLAALNLVTIFPQRGTVIAPLRAIDLLRSQFLRESLEVGLVRRAIRAPGRGNLVRRLRAELTVQQAYASIGEEVRFYASDEALHMLIAHSAGLPGIWEDIAHAKLHMDRFRRLALASVEGLPVVLEQHVRIVDAIEAGDEEEAERRMKQHLRRIFSTAEKAYASHPNYFEEGWDMISFMKQFEIEK
jgi:GntR family transcriptional regulator, rspAB operon transcriptional repressor